MRLPDGRDPDEVIRDEPEVWRAATEEPQPIMEFLIDRAAARFDQRSVSGRERLVAAVLPTLRTVSDPVRRDGYVQLLARRSGVEERTLLEALRRPQSGARSGAAADVGHAGSRINLEAILAQPDALDPRAVDRAIEPAEAALLRLLLVQPGLMMVTTRRLASDHRFAEEPFVTTPARELWRAMTDALGADAQAQQGGRFDRAAFVAGLDPTLGTIARTLMARTDPLPASEPEMAQAVEQSLLTLERGRLSERIEFTRARLAEAEASHDESERQDLQREVLELQRRRLELDRAVADSSLLARRRIQAKPSAREMEVAHGD